MSLLNNQSQASESTAFWAPASGGGGGGSVPANISASTITLDGASDTAPALITLNPNTTPVTNSGAINMFAGTYKTINSGILNLYGTSLMQSVAPGAPTQLGLYVNTYSTIGASAGVCCNTLFLNNFSPAGGSSDVPKGTPITSPTSGVIALPMSSIVGVSSMNGIPTFTQAQYNALSTLAG